MHCQTKDHTIRMIFILIIIYPGKARIKKRLHGVFKTLYNLFLLIGPKICCQLPE